MTRQRSSADVFAAANKLIPGGVNSPVRAWRGVGGVPVHIAESAGARVTSLEGVEYIDLVLAYGPQIVGHGHPAVREALHAAVDSGTAFGAPTAGELELAERIVERMPAVEMVRLVNSGTEATMSALRLARAVTQRDFLIKFEGCYHGHGDSFLVKAGSGALTLGQPDSPGVPATLAEKTLVAVYNDLASVRALFEAQPEGVAAVFVEPVVGNMGCVLPAEGFLQGLRELCDEFGALLVYDEVMTGFRVARGGYQDLDPVRPDLVTMGKVIGGGLPIGAYGGRADLLEHVAPSGPVYQAGTLSGNPLAVAAGLATLAVLDQPGTYEQLERAGERLASGLERLAAERDVPLTVNRCGSMLGAYLNPGPVASFDEVMKSDRESWPRFFHAMLEHGVLLAPSPFEAWFLSTAHDDATIDGILAAAAHGFDAVRG